MFNWYDLWRDYIKNGWLFSYNPSNRGKGHNKQPHNRSHMNAIKRKQRAKSLRGRR